MIANYKKAMMLQKGIVEEISMLKLNFTPFPELTTERLVLRKISATDENEVFLLRSDERVNKYVDRPKARSLEDARKHIHNLLEGIKNNNLVFWAIALKNNPKLIGTICLWNISKENATGEIGYELLPEFQGQGIMQEAIVKVIEFGFESMNLETIDAWVMADNERSIKILERNNFIRNLHAEMNIDRSAGGMPMTIYTLSRNG